MTRPVVGFAGMTHLGIVSASAIASAGFETVCFDPDAQLIAKLQEARLPVLEPDLDLAHGRRSLRLASPSSMPTTKGPSPWPDDSPPMRP